jgi:hypothetical protein
MGSLLPLVAQSFPKETVQLRYEGIDTIEKAAIQPLAMEWTHATKTLSSYERVMMLCLALLAVSPAFRKDDTPLNRKPGGLMEQTNASLQRGDQG